MRLFGRKRNKDEEGLDENDPTSRKATRGKRKKKKESPKPWGKTERFVVLFFLLLTIGISVYLALDARGWEFPGVTSIKIPDTELPFISEETIIIEK